MPRKRCTFLLQGELIIWTIYLGLCRIHCHMNSLNQNWMPFLKMRSTSLGSYVSGEGLTRWNSVICKAEKPVTIWVPFNTKIGVNQCQVNLSHPLGAKNCVVLQWSQEVSPCFSFRILAPILSRSTALSPLPYAFLHLQKWGWLSFWCTVPSKVLSATEGTDIIPFIFVALQSFCHLRKVWAPVSNVH